MTTPLGAAIGLPSIHIAPTTGPQATEGSLGAHAVEVGQAQPRANNALKTVWMEVKHFFTSLFGVRVSSPNPAHVSNLDQATQAVLHSLTRREPDPFAVLGALSEMLEQGRFPQDEARDGITEGADKAFGQALGGLSDMQLFRLHGNFRKHPELLEGLAQLGTGANMALDNPSTGNLRGGGKVNDLGFLTLSLHDRVRSELDARGYGTDDIPRGGAEPGREMELFAKNAALNGGDLGAALVGAKADLAKERRDALVRVLDDTFGMGAPSPNPDTLARKRDAALDDSRLLQLRYTRDGGMNATALLSFFDAHFEACSSPAFWSHPSARMNAENFGIGLSLSFLHKAANGRALTPEGLQTLHGVLGPFVTEGVPPAPTPDPSLAGKMTDATLGALCDMVFERYMSPTAAYPLNMENAPHEARVREVFADPASKGAQKLAALTEAYSLTLAGQQFATNNLTDPLKAIA